MPFTSIAAIFGTSLLVGLTGALSPGPLTTLAIREGVRRGPWAGPMLAFGHGVLELAVVAGLALGLNQVLGHDAVAVTIAAVGGLFLLWLGWRIIWTARRQELRIEADSVGDEIASGGEAGRRLAAALSVGAMPSPRQVGTLALLGLAVSLANPFWAIWWITIGSAYIAEALDHGTVGVLSFYGGHILADLGWLTIIAVALSSGRRIMSTRAYQGILIACGAFLLGLGLWFLWSIRGFLS